MELRPARPRQTRGGRANGQYPVFVQPCRGTKKRLPFNGLRWHLHAQRRQTYVSSGFERPAVLSSKVQPKTVPSRTPLTPPPPLPSPLPILSLVFSRRVFPAGSVDNSALDIKARRYVQIRTAAHRPFWPLLWSRAVHMCGDQNGEKTTTTKNTQKTTTTWKMLSLSALVRQFNFPLRLINKVYCYCCYC